jgi:uncharacterized protein
MQLSNLLAAVSLIVGLLALIKSTLERRAAGRLPIANLIRERFGHPQLNPILIGLAIGTAVIVGPFGLALALGWVKPVWAGDLSGDFLLLGLGTVFIKLAWAAAEELIFRGAVLPQAARRTNGLIGLALSALLFAWGHLERGGAQTPNVVSLLVFGLDGIGFALAYLATRSLWLPTLWHAAKNIWVWLLVGQSTLQLTHGLLASVYSGPQFWLGTPNQAGWLDVAAAALVVVLFAAGSRRALAQGLGWVKSQ